MSKIKRNRRKYEYICVWFGDEKSSSKHKMMENRKNRKMEIKVLLSVTYIIYIFDIKSIFTINNIERE